MNGFSSVVVAGTQSGVGKTSVSLALVGALQKRGLKTQTFKCGPDFLDPTWLRAASGRYSYNLDGWMMGKEYVKSLYSRCVADADVAVTEGVMGMFDSAGPDTIEGSTAEIAMILGAPVVLVVDAGGMAASIGAMVKGYAHYRPGANICGVIANNVGSGRHGELLAEALAAADMPPLLGAVPRGAFPGLGSRHLGLVAAEEENVAAGLLESLAAAAEKFINLDLLIETTRVKRPCSPPMAQTAKRQKGRIGVAVDRAFHFYYRDTMESLEAQGCEIVEFSPLADGGLPEPLTALYLGGGYPEEHAETLSQNIPMNDAIRSFAASGRPVYAECGGMMYLSRGVETTDGKRHPFVGLLPFWTRMRKNFKSLGYVEALLKGDSFWGPAGTAVRGHRFHYSEIVESEAREAGWQPAYAIRRRNREDEGEDGFLRDNVLAGYVHAHFASRPRLVEHFAAHCSEGKSDGKGNDTKKSVYS